MTMFVIKRDGREEPVHFDKITARINKLAYGLNQEFCDPVRLRENQMTEPGSGDGRDAPESRSTRISRARTPRVHPRGERSRVPLPAVSHARSRASCDSRSVKRHLSGSRCARSRRLKKAGTSRARPGARGAPASVARSPSSALVESHASPRPLHFVGPVAHPLRRLKR